MSIKTWAIAKAIVKASQDVNSKGLVSDLASDVDKYLDESFPKRSEVIQSAVVRNILLPLIRELMRDNLEQYDSMIENEANFIEIEHDRREERGIT